MRIAPVLLIFGLLVSIQTFAQEPLREFIYDTAPFPSAHASTIVELSNGDLLAAWFGGTREGNTDVAIWGSRRANGTWSEPFELVRENGTPTWNPVLFHSNDKKLWLYYKFGPNPMSWTGGRLSSSDEGKTWAASEHLPAGLYGPIRAKPLILKNGTIVSGTSVESYRSWAVWIERSEDNGKSWSKFGPITIPPDLYPTPKPEDVPGSNDRAFTEGIIQPTIVSLGGKRLRLYARSPPRMGKICVADSNDNGKTWTQARPIDLPNPNAGIDAVRLNDGRIVLVYNHTDSGRTPLNLAVSKDGESFRMFYTLENDPGEYSYPAMIQGKNGDLLITYTWNRKKIRYARLRSADIPLSSDPKSIAP